MPFRSEKQRRYLWANEPKIAREWTDEYALGELWIFNEDGSLVAEFHGFRSQYLKGSRGEQGGEQDKWFYEYKWKKYTCLSRKLKRN